MTKIVFEKFYYPRCNMKYKLLLLLISFISLSSHTTKAQSLVGKWQLVHFDGIEKIKNSIQYREADFELRAGMDLRIKDRLENTVYQFISPDSLLFNEFIDHVVVQQKARFDIDKNQILTITSPETVKKAKIIILEDLRLVLEPFVAGNSVGKWVFDRILENIEN